jgi:PAS domain S-box-containing protein
MRLVQLHSPVSLATIASIVALCVALFALQRGIHKENESWQWVLHTREVLEGEQATLTLAQHAESSQRGFLLTRQASYIASYQQAKNALFAEIKNLQALTADNPVQQQALRIYEDLASQCFQRMEVLLKEGAEGGKLEASQLEPGRALKAKLVSQAGRIKAEEEQLLQRRLQTVDQTRTELVAAVAAVIAVAILLIILLRFISERDARRIRRGQRQLQQALERESLAKTRLEIALESASMGTWQVDLQTGKRNYSDAVGPMFGRPAGFVHAGFEDWLNDIHPDDRAKVRAAWEAALSCNHYYAVEFRAIGTNGKIRWLASSGKVACNADGRPAAIIGTTRDVTDRINTSEELHQQREELQTVLNVLPVGMVITHDPSANQIAVTPYYAKMLELDIDALGTSGFDIRKGLPFALLRNGKVVDVDDLPLQRAARTGTDIRNEEFEVRLAGDRRLNILVNASPLLDKEGKLRGSVAAIMDVTSLKNIQQELERADRQKNEFLSVLAHELRNPMAAIGYSAELLQHISTPEAIARAVEVIKRQTEHTGRLLDELLDLSRISNNKIELKRLPIDLRHVIELSLESVKPLIASSRLDVRLDLSPTPVRISGDEVRLTQVVSNILHNAAKFTGENGRIDVHAYQSDGRAVLDVTDNGVGIAPDQLENIFEMFSQMQSKRHGGAAGLGIGLAIVRSLVELHGGFVNAYSDGKGKGSRIHIELPLLYQETFEEEPAETQDVSAQRAAQDAVQNAAQDKVRLLLADDNADAADALSSMLSLSGYSVQTVYDGRAAMEKAGAFKPEVALLDIGMPLVNGYEVAQWIRAQEWGHDAILIAVTGWGQPSDRKATLESGFDAHLVKPVYFTDIRSAIASLKQEES